MKATGIVKRVLSGLCVLMLLTSCTSLEEKGNLFDESSVSSESSQLMENSQPQESTSENESKSEMVSETEPSPEATEEPISTPKPTPKPTAKPTPVPTQEPLKTVNVTIPEGYTVPQIAELLEKKGVCSASEFVKVSQNYTPKSFTISLDSRRAYRMEGYLFPDTYEFYVDDDPENVLIRLLNNYNAKAGGISDKQLIVASIVEKESRSAENAAMVASVIYNRLNAGMKLEMDATREYVNQSITGSPYLGSTGSYAALYNTYKCSALPVGPICCPGSRAIQAAVSPASSEYYYFFFGNDNQNHYSKTYEEHVAAMEKYGVQYG